MKYALWLTWVGMVAAVVSYAVAQQTVPQAVNGCVVVGSAPTLSAGTQTVFTCNTSGQLRMSTTP